MISLNARYERYTDGQNSWEQYSIPVNSNLYLYLEHSLRQSRIQLGNVVRQIQEAHIDWLRAHDMGRLPTTRIVEIYSKCITVRKHISKLKTFATKQREFEKLHKLMQDLRPYTIQLHSAIARLQDAIETLENALKEAITLQEIPGMTELIFYREWTVTRFIEFLQMMLDKYQWELERKKLMEVRIVSTMDRDELRTCRSLWHLLHISTEYIEFIRKYSEFDKEISEEHAIQNNAQNVNYKT